MDQYKKIPRLLFDASEIGLNLAYFLFVFPDNVFEASKILYADAGTLSAPQDATPTSLLHP
jgi:hypothetical protein